MKDAFKIGVLLSAVMLSSGTYAQVDNDEFAAMLEERKAQSSGSQEDNDSKDDEEIKVEALDSSLLFKEIDNQQAKIHRLEQMIAIAELEQQYMELTGSAPEDAVTLNNTRESSEESESKEEKLLQRIEGLERKISSLASESQSAAPGPGTNYQQRKLEPMPSMEDEVKTLVSSFWRVRGISIYDGERQAVIEGMSGNSFPVSPGDEVAGVKIVSIQPDSVSVKEDGETNELTLAGSGVADEADYASTSSQQSQMMMNPEMFMNPQGVQPSAAGGGPGYQDSTSISMGQ